ncbi:MAG: hypothetical protein ABS46_07940 [Cytophagaceae bacterium SCN 52-12]|nr:MAG: hypothetical protein ABS46_07940 [Cytophagaceae bacterium SCN 52-12]
MRSPVSFILACLLFLHWSSTAVKAQTYRVSGVLKDSADNSGVIGAYVKLYPVSDTTKAVYTASDVAGNFQFSGVLPQSYRMVVTNLSYENVTRNFEVRDANVNLGTITMKTGTHMLKEVQVVGAIQQSQQKGDTTQYNAAAFKVNPDATTEDLIRKMPGITVENGEVQAQGETVQRVLVDGKPFFGDDATLAIRNLPAEIVDKIEVFDRQSDQAQFSGFDDGNAQKTINIVTRADRNRGQFGKVFAGYGLDNRFMAGGNINIFGAGHRLSLIGLSNNVNQQNFGSQDLAGVLGSSSGSRGGGGSRGGRGGSSADNFIVGQQSGITNTTALGMNYTGNWGKKTEVTGSYFFNKAGNVNRQITGRETFLSRGNQLYSDTSVSSNTNYNHRFNIRLEHKINERNSLIFTPSLSFQNNESRTDRSGITSYKDDGSLINLTENHRVTHTTAYNINNSLLWRHRFAKAGRTFSINFTSALNNRDRDGSLNSRNLYFTNLTNPGDTINQISGNRTKGLRLGADANYTEPVGKRGQLQLGYSISVSNNNSKSETHHYSEATQDYTIIDSLLSNTFDNRYTTQRGGVSYRLRTQSGMMFSTGFDLQHANLYSQQLFPGNNKVDNSFFNVLPNAMLMIGKRGGTNFRLFYRASTQEPSINQLQNVIDNSNPLFMSAGNPDLKQSYRHMLSARFNTIGAQTGHNLFVLISGNIVNNYITNSTIIAQEPTLLPNGLLLEQGAQFTAPVNVNGNMGLRGFVTYGMPIKSWKLNVNLNSGLNYQRMPGMINNVRNLSNTYTMSQGLVISSNISQNLDFAVSYNGNYNIVKNSIQQSANNNYLSQGMGARANWIFGKGFVLQSDINNQSYRGLGEGFNQTYTLWNAGFGKKMFKNNAAELKVTVFDILGQNNSISRSVTETYQQDVISQVLTRYAMLTFTYNLRNFGSRQSGSQQPAFEREQPYRERMPGEGGFRREGGGFRDGGGFRGN